MKITKNLLVSVAACGLMMSSAFADDMVAKGEKIFTTLELGNCQACHDANGKKLDGPGSFGPKLVGLKYWDDQTLYDTVYDIYKARGLKISAMPAFGPTGHLSDEEIKAVVAYLKTID